MWGGALHGKIVLKKGSKAQRLIRLGIFAQKAKINLSEHRKDGVKAIKKLCEDLGKQKTKKKIAYRKKSDYSSRGDTNGD